jgi:hypothetical protein
MSFIQNIDASRIKGIDALITLGKTQSSGVTFSASVTNTITHNLNSTGIVVQMWDVSTGEAIYGTLDNRTLTTVDITLSATFSSPGVDIIIIG